MSTRTNPLIALIFSAVLPGLGQVYNGERDKGLLILGSCLALGLFVYWVSGFNKLSAALALLLIWLSAVIDAYKVAKSAGETAEFYYAKKLCGRHAAAGRPARLAATLEEPELFQRRAVGVDGDRGRGGAVVYRDAVFVEVADPIITAT